MHVNVNKRISDNEQFGARNGPDCASRRPRHSTGSSRRPDDHTSKATSDAEYRTDATGNSGNKSMPVYDAYLAMFSLSIHMSGYAQYYRRIDYLVFLFAKQMLKLKFLYSKICITILVNIQVTLGNGELNTCQSPLGKWTSEFEPCRSRHVGPAVHHAGNPFIFAKEQPEVNRRYAEERAPEDREKWDNDSECWSARSGGGKCVGLLQKWRRSKQLWGSLQVSPNIKSSACYFFCRFITNTYCFIYVHNSSQPINAETVFCTSIEFFF